MNKLWFLRHLDLFDGMSDGEMERLGAPPGADDAQHLVFLREKLGRRFLCGAVLHTGPRAFVLSERVFALPICALWGRSA